MKGVAAFWKVVFFLVDKLRALVDVDRRRTVVDIATEIGTSYGTMERILENDRNKKKVVARWVPRLFSRAEMEKRMQHSMRCLIICAVLAIFAGQVFAQVTQPEPRNGTAKPPIEEKTVAPGEKFTGIPTEGDRTSPAPSGVDPSHKPPTGDHPEPDSDREEAEKGKMWKNRIAKWKKMRLNKKVPEQVKPEIKEDKKPGQKTKNKAKGSGDKKKFGKPRQPFFGKRRGTE
ncbi:uncharacterized protein LOC133185080 [Saccostrea echinata]|uniref:uncharacterized protein LOC133185080 n=1 Tax=Saccostrea echinata TaxID=191078 RepID=UPI002A81841F|nr:uncharacterized protein LOC133185080 [Saccostrea echinata]